MLTLDEYTAEVKRHIREAFKKRPRREVELYLMALEKKGYIRRSYESDLKKSAKILRLEGKDLDDMDRYPNPSGFCYVAILEYPDLPY